MSIDRIQGNSIRENLYSSLEDKSTPKEQLLQQSQTQVGKESPLNSHVNTALDVLGELEISKMDVETLLVYVMSQRSTVMNELTEKQALVVQARNEEIKGWGMLKSKLAVYGTGDPGASTPDPSKKVELGKDGKPSAQELQTIITTYNLSIDLKAMGVNGNTITVGKLAEFNQTIDTSTTSATNMQNMEFLKLQNLVQKSTQAAETASTLATKFNNTRSAIIRNLGS